MDEQTKREVLIAVAEIVNGSVKYDSERVKAHIEDEYDGWVTLTLEVKY